MPLCSKISIYSINDKEVKSGYSYVCIKDIGPGGLCFNSPLDFPIKSNIVLNFNMILINRHRDFRGNIVRKKRISEDKWEYGVEFSSLNYSLQLKYIRLFNEVAMQIFKNKNYLINGFCNKQKCKNLKYKVN